jgi:hypothetical protein
VTRPRAADDFATIRARMHELRRENTARPARPMIFRRSEPESKICAGSAPGHLRHQSRARFPRGPIITRAPDRRTASRGVCLRQFAKNLPAKEREGGQAKPPSFGRCRST